LLELIIILISLLLTFYFSGTETAFISVNRVRIELWRRQKSRIAHIIAKFLINPEKFIYTTLVGNNIANIAFASYATIYFHQYLNEKVTWLLITAITILWGEIIPKTLFRSLADWIIRKVALILYFFYYVFKPIIWIISYISGIILRIFGQPASELSNFFSKRDIEILIKESKDSADLDEGEGVILSRLLDLRQLRVRDAMIRRTEMVAINDKTSIPDLSKVFRKSGLTKIPVFRENLDDIIGVVILKDLFLKPESVDQIIREVIFVPETKNSLDLLKQFQDENASMAIVVDEYGGTAGLVTTEDLIEELVGEIDDEFDETENLIRKIDDKTYSVNPRIELDELTEIIKLDIPEGNYDTLAGFILNQLGHIPRCDETITYNDVTITVTRASHRKIDRVRINLP
jgi:putative hemolysin